jgi:PhzF family phenazine biosynthesis protein
MPFVGRSVRASPALARTGINDVAHKTVQSNDSANMPQPVGVMLLPYFQVDAFASAVFQGNPAGVVVTDRALSESQMQHIAEENKLAETAFVTPADHDFSLRWFTPVQEVPFCGHATLAAAHVLISEYNVPGACAFQSAVGPLRVEREEGRLTLEVPALAPQPASEVESTLLELVPDNFVAAFKNFENLFVELRDEEAVRAYQPNLTRIAQLHPFGLAITAKGRDVDFVSRYFAPSYGIPEDAVTGSTHATLVPYWAGALGRHKLVARQLSERGGELTTRIAGDRVWLSGQATTFLKGTIYLPYLR